MFFDAVENTFKILEARGITREFLYGNAEGENNFNLSLGNLCSTLGIEVIFDNDLRDEQGRIISGRSCAESRQIFINNNDVGERMRFTLGHELYHILNNQNENRSRYEKNEFNKDKEDKKKINELIANAFSAELLMPEEFVRRKIGEFGLDINRLAVYFKVSIPAMYYRLLNLGIIRTL